MADAHTYRPHLNTMMSGLEGYANPMSTNETAPLTSSLPSLPSAGAGGSMPSSMLINGLRSTMGKMRCTAELAYEGRGGGEVGRVRGVNRGTAENGTAEPYLAHVTKAHRGLSHAHGCVEKGWEVNQKGED